MTVNRWLAEAVRTVAQDGVLLRIRNQARYPLVTPIEDAAATWIRNQAGNPVG